MGSRVVRFIAGKYVDYAKRHNVFMIAAIPLGIWAAISLTLTRNGFLTDNVFLAAAIAFGPAIVAGVLHIFLIGHAAD